MLFGNWIVGQAEDPKGLLLSIAYMPLQVPPAIILFPARRGTQPGKVIIMKKLVQSAGVAELADAADSKSAAV
jgi:hypothetical protein